MKIQKNERGGFSIRFRRAFCKKNVEIAGGGTRVENGVRNGEKSGSGGSDGSDDEKCGSGGNGATFGTFAAFVSLIFVATFVGAAAFPTVVRAEAGDELLSAGLEKHRAGQYQEAISTLDQFIASYPTSKSRNKAELFDGHSHLALGSFVDAAETAKARQHFQYVINQGKNAEYYKEATFHNAHSYFDLRAYSDAKPLFEAFLKDYPKDAYAQYVYYYLGVCEAQTGAYDKAISYFDRNLNEYPNSPLRWTCRLEKAATTGQSGNYADAESQLTQLAVDSNLPSDVAGQVVVQRALLQIVQQKYDAAIQILEDFVARYRNDAAMAEVIQDAYLYEAYAYFAKQEFERALLIVETMERASATIAPETALLKIKLLINLNRVDEAESLLDKLAASNYGQETPDAIVSYRALISLARGDWDASIRSLVDLLKVRQSPTKPNAVVFEYFDAAATNPTRDFLEPHDVVEALGVLTLAYASRYAAKKNESDNLAQAAVFQAAFDYAASRDNPGLDLIIAAIDARRRSALTKPIDSSTGTVSVASPSTGSNAGAGGFLNPTDSNNFNNPGFRGPNRPGATSGGGSESAAPPTGNGTGNGGANGAPIGTGAGAANGSGTGNELFAAGSGGGSDSQTTGSKYGATGADAATESTPLTPEAAREALQKATTYYVNQEYDRANEILLAATTSSETFWDDCPAEAARISLLRANALFALNKRSEAQLTCQNLLDNAPYSQEAAVANFYLGYGADYFGRRDDAIKYLRQAVNSKNESPFTDVALYYLGMNEWERRDVEGAERTFARLCREYPKSAYWSHSIWATAKIESDARNDVVAEQLVNEALRKKPDAAIVDYLLFLKGEIALRAKDYRKASVAFEMIVDQYPDGIWYSKAKNRLASIPTRFQSASSTDDSRKANANPSSSTAPTSRPSVRPSTRPTSETESPENDGFAARIESPTTPDAAARGSASSGFDRSRRPNAPSNAAAPGDPRSNGSNGFEADSDFNVGAPTTQPTTQPTTTRPTDRSNGRSNAPNSSTSLSERQPRVYELSFADETLRF